MEKSGKAAGKHGKRWWLIAAGAVAAAVLGVGATATATGVLDDEGGLSGPEADRARDAALRAVGGGKANSVELDHEDGATYEVEVTRRDGTTVDVRLDKDFRVVVIEPDSESPDRDGDGDGDGER
ncbi:MAG TPA: PepSY domain-containing protein [Candidatus Limnocylindrales bacterium]|nr:PepSY domain-containing protein [Candidatus Limnocylindrales bacterium]